MYCMCIQMHINFIQKTMIQDDTKMTFDMKMRVFGHNCIFKNEMNAYDLRPADP